MMGLKWPLSVYFLIVFEFCNRLSFHGIRSLMPLYFGHVLLDPESRSTVMYHLFIMICYLVPLASAILADGYLGRFQTIIVFLIVGTAGSIIITIASTGFLQDDTKLWSLIGLASTAIGSGGMMPCIAAFTGDQIKLPSGSQILQSFSTFFYLVAHLGSLAGMIVTPILKTSFSCFGSTTCYALGFGVAAAFMIASAVAFLLGTTSYIIYVPQENTMLQFFGCVFYAIFHKVRLQRETRRKHWLDYATHKYDAILINDIKVVLSIFLLFLPLPIFWSLFVQQGSRWTLQATKLNGKLELLGVEIHPDQIQAVGPIILVVLIPVFNNVIYPCFNKWHFLTIPLERMTAGGIAAGLAFITAGVLERHLDSAFPPIRGSSEAQAVLINASPCEIDVSFENGPGQIIPSGEVVHVIGTPVNESFHFQISGFWRPCRDRTPVYTAVKIHNLQVIPIVVDYKSNALTTRVLNNEDIGKLLSGNPKIKLIYLRDGDEEFNEARVTLYSCLLDSLKVFSVQNNNVTESSFVELAPMRYRYDVAYNFEKQTTFTGFFDLQSGGVYFLVIREINDHIVFAHRFVIIPPNATHVFWIIPQYVIMCIAEILFVLSGIEFCFTQAPCGMKTIVMAAWYFTMACGNLLVILITRMQLFKCQANEYFLFAGLVIIDSILFYWACLHCNLVGNEIGDKQEEVCEPVPLLIGLPSEQTFHVVMASRQDTPRVPVSASETILKATTSYQINGRPSSPSVRKFPASPDADIYRDLQSPGYSTAHTIKSTKENEVNIFQPERKRLLCRATSVTLSDECTV